MQVFATEKTTVWEGPWPRGIPSRSAPDVGQFRQLTGFGSLFIYFHNCSHSFIKMLVEPTLYHRSFQIIISIQQLSLKIVFSKGV